MKPHSPSNTSADMLLVLCTCPDQATAQGIAKGLLENKLAACINMVPGIQSLYQWQGKMTDSQEVLLIMKTLDQIYPKLERHVKENHPYECPEILALPVSHGWPGYVEWVRNELS